MSTTIGSDHIALQQADPNEQSKGIWSKVCSALSRIRISFSGLIDRVKTSLTAFKFFILGKQNGYSVNKSVVKSDVVDPKNTDQNVVESERPNVVDKSVVKSNVVDRDLRKSMRLYLDRVLAKIEPLMWPYSKYDSVLFVSGVNAHERSSDPVMFMRDMMKCLYSELSGFTGHALSWETIKRFKEPLAPELASRIKNITDLVDGIFDLFLNASKARKEGAPLDAMHYEIVFLSSMLGLSLEDARIRHADDLESNSAKRSPRNSLKYPGLIVIDVLIDLKRGVTSHTDAERNNIGVPTEIKRKCEEMFEIIDMLADNKLTLKTNIKQEDGSVYEDDRLQNAFFERHPEWQKIKSDGLLTRLFQANGDCFYLDQKTSLPLFREYVESLDRAKELFDKGQVEESFEIVEKILNKAFNIKV